jgi:hypothetical protein
MQKAPVGRWFLAVPAGGAVQRLRRKPGLVLGVHLAGHDHVQAIPELACTDQRAVD